MLSKKVIVCDLDGTLAVSKSPLSPEMAEVLSNILSRKYMAVVSGGSYEQFKKQFISRLPNNSEILQNLYLFPTMGSTCYVYNKTLGGWEKVYDEGLSEKERSKIIKAFEEIIKKYNLNKEKTYGDIIEDRGGQVTFSALGQDAPIELKKDWDPNQDKRKEMVEILSKKLPEFEIRIGGTTSIDVTKKGLDKAYAIQKIKQMLHANDEDIIFVGDALYKGGNDESIKSTGVDFIQKSGPNETLELLSRYM